MFRLLVHLRSLPKQDCVIAGLLQRFPSIRVILFRTLIERSLILLFSSAVLTQINEKQYKMLVSCWFLM
ncbi:unnamed protein product [Schistosoma mattheei]|uniref:Uncharacterized protein n=1 Tax=Schistosoma mattheei TaxID=31246 RepID=A0AA85B7X4_9TREM|nr:unnamed protein product [Schistosoma mattheei]CAH8460264.1 unnamed protein product [Schistosoma haematobium]